MHPDSRHPSGSEHNEESVCKHRTRTNGDAVASRGARGTGGGACGGRQAQAVSAMHGKAFALVCLSSRCCIYPSLMTRFPTPCPAPLVARLRATRSLPRSPQRMRPPVCIGATAHAGESPFKLLLALALVTSLPLSSPPFSLPRIYPPLASIRASMRERTRNTAHWHHS